MTTLAAPARPVGQLLREWRERRRLSQLELSIRAEISTRHLSFVETGRSRPTPEMIIRLTDQLDVPLRERNQLLLAGGYAPAYPQHAMDAPELTAVREALRQVLTGHQPNPALIINRWWELQDANAAARALIGDLPPHLLEPPVNVLRISLHPDGMAGRIVNLAQWRSHLLARLRHRGEQTGDPRLADLLEEMRGYPGGEDAAPPAGNVVVPLRLANDGGEISLFSIAAAVETATDVTVQELVVESFYPADASTAKWLQSLVSD